MLLVDNDLFKQLTIVVLIFNIILNFIQLICKLCQGDRWSDVQNVFAANELEFLGVVQNIFCKLSRNFGLADMEVNQVLTIPSYKI
jgi:hypothetical protein